MTPDDTDVLPPIDDATEEADDFDAREYDEVVKWFRFRVRPECETNDFPW